MEDLFKQFRDNLENRPEPPFEERDWQDMQARLERDGRKRPMPSAWWWMVVPFMLLLTGSNAFFFWQWKKTEQLVSSLGLRRDTVFHTRMVYTTDTIYRTRVVRERVLQYQTSYAPGRLGWMVQERDLRSLGQVGVLTERQIQQHGSLPLLHQNEQVEQAFPGIQNEKSAKPDLTDMSLKGEKPRADQALVQKNMPLLLGGIPPIVYPQKMLDLADYQVLIPAQKHKKSFSDYLYNSRPKAYQLGVSSSLAYPFGSGVDFKSGYSIGVHTAIEFSPSLRLWADAAYFKTHFLTDRMGDDIGVPIEGPPSDEYIFLQAEVPQPFFQYAAGMQYLFHTKNKIKPFVGLGLGAISLLQYDLTYEFENATLGIEWNLDKTVHRQGLITNFLVLPVGMEYGFSKHWYGQIQAKYRYNWKGTGVKSPNLLGIQGGLNYRF